MHLNSFRSYIFLQHKLVFDLEIFFQVFVQQNHFLSNSIWQHHFLPVFVSPKVMIIPKINNDPPLTYHTCYCEYCGSENYEAYDLLLLLNLSLLVHDLNEVCFTNACRLNANIHITYDEHSWFYHDQDWQYKVAWLKKGERLPYLIAFTQK